MPTVTSYRNGSSAGVGGGNPSPVKRGEIKGWTPGAVRRHTAWLYSINAPALDGVGLALTLTMRSTPATAADFERLRVAYVRRLERAGATRIHWVVEWQRRGVPHVHAAVYYPAGTDPQQAATRALLAWLALAGDFGARAEGQWWDLIAGAEGWLHYLSKHAARGVRHYQRWGKPFGWETTGRLWGKRGEWPTDAPMRFRIDQAGYWRLRRLIRSWRVADARTRRLGPHGDRGRTIASARGMLRDSDRRRSPVRGFNDWVPESTLLELLELVRSEGYSVEQISEI